MTPAPAATPETTSLDDLFTRAEAASPGRVRSPARQWLGWLLKATVAAAGLAGALVLAFQLAGYDLWFPLPMAGFLALFWLHRMVAGMRVVRSGRAGAPPDADPADPADPPDQLLHAVQEWQTRLSWSRARIRPHTHISPLLAEIVDERLRQRHGVTMAGDPAQARALLGERLWAFLSDPAARTPPPRKLAALLTEVEAL